ncbi:MAG: hypothetical protein AB7E24_25790, partial [Novosphingobium sp.]
LITGCTGAASARRRVCEEHWRALPGKMRSRLSLTAGFGQTARSDEAWDRARQLLERAPG